MKIWQRARHDGLLSRIRFPRNERSLYCSQRQRRYEDWTSGHITEYNFKMLSHKYQTEQQELVEKIDRLKTELSVEKQTTADAEKGIALIKQYSNPRS